MSLDLRQYTSTFVTKSNDGREVTVLRPSAALVASVRDQLLANQTPWEWQHPVMNSDHWDDDNYVWVLPGWLGGQAKDLWGRRKPNVAQFLNDSDPDALFTLIEAYLARVLLPNGDISSFEQVCCNGSSFSPDDQLPLSVWAKDPAAMFHDYVWLLHRARIANMAGKVWTFRQANVGYKNIYAADSLPSEGQIRLDVLQSLAIGRWESQL